MLLASAMAEETSGNAQISAYDPAAVLALRGELKLTDDQVKNLEAIAATTQDQMKSRLIAEQLASLARILAWKDGELGLQYHLSLPPPASGFSRSPFTDAARAA
jgi:hypothetical protein